MSNSTNFIDQITIVQAAWLNDVNAAVYSALGDGSLNPPTTPAQVATNIGAAKAGAIGSSGITGAALAGPLGSSGITGAAASGDIGSSGLTGEGVTTPLSVGKGGTGANTHTLNNVLLGNTTGALKEVAPGASGNVLTSDGTIWNSSAPIAVTSKIQPVTCTQASGALTFGLNPTVLDFRSTTLTTGVPNTRTVSSALSLVLPSGGTLGAVSTIAAELILVAIDNVGTVELAVINIAGGNDLSEVGLISTTAISASATANNVFYSTNARTNVPYRVIGLVGAVNTSGAWATPVLVQGFGGQAVTDMTSIGYGQTWQNVTRTGGTTYYNTTGRPIFVRFTYGGASYSMSVTVNGITVGSANDNNSTTSESATISAIVPIGASYSCNNISSAAELR